MSMQKLYIGMVVCISLLHSCLCVWICHLQHCCVYPLPWPLLVGGGGSDHLAFGPPASGVWPQIQVCQCGAYMGYICSLTCIYLWQISQIQTCLRVVVGPRLVSTSPAFMKSISSHLSRPHGRLVQQTVIGPPLLGAEGSTQFAQGLPDRCVRSTACRLCRLQHHHQ